MKTLIIFLLTFFVWGNIHAQTTIYFQDFETSYSDWTLTSTDLGGVSTPNYWTVTNVYTGNIIAPTVTPDEPSGITAYPESYYMHIRSTVGPANATFNASGTHTYLSAMNSPLVTTGFTNVSISFWWLCRGNASCFGRLYYRTSASSTAWIQVSTASTPPAALDSFNNSYATWTLQTIHIAAFDNQPFLEFAFQFYNAPPAGNDPSFAVDDIKVVGTPGAAPVTSYSVTATSACQDSSITATSTTPGTVDSVRWSVTPTAGATINTPTATATSITFTTAGTYSVTLTAYSGGLSDASTNVITVIPTPSPVIVNNPATHTLSVTGSYTSYQWASGSPIPSAITGATNSTYTYSVAGTYYVGVDSDGCQGYSPVPFVYTPTGVANINSTASNKYWFNASGGSLNLYAAQAVSENLTINIYDATGRRILNDVWESGSDTKQLSSAFFPPGMYIIKLSNNKTSIVFRWVK